MTGGGRSRGRRLRFLTAPGALSGEPGRRVSLLEEEVRHVRTSLRGRPGEEIFVFDGEGIEWSAVLEGGPGRGLSARLVAPVTEAVESPLVVSVLQAVSREDAFDEAVDLLTALGVAEVVPLLVERAAAARPPDARRLGRWRRIARESAKLSWRRVVPRIAEPIRLDAVPRIEGADSRGFLLDPEGPCGSLGAALASPPPERASIAVGPEGGFTPGEVEALRMRDYRPVELGPRILRTEHAGAALVAILQASWGDLGARTAPQS